MDLNVKIRFKNNLRITARRIFVGKSLRLNRIAFPLIIEVTLVVMRVAFSAIVVIVSGALFTRARARVSSSKKRLARPTIAK